MKERRSKWRAMLPDPPTPRYSPVYGTNRWREWAAAWRWLVMGTDAEDIPVYEGAMAAACGARHAVSFGAGRMAMYVLLRALGLRSGDEVILPGFTCTVVPNALLYQGIRPVYVDIDPVTFLIDPLKVEGAISARTRAICAQHTFGVGCDIARLQEIAARHRLLLIEDCAHSLGARFVDGRPHGSVGDAAIISTDRTKVIGTHIGGCAVTSHDDLADRMRSLRDQCAPLGRVTQRRILTSFLLEHALRAPGLLWIGRPLLGVARRLGFLFQWRDEPFDAIPRRYPYPCPLPAALATWGLLQLRHLDAILAHRRCLAAWIEDRVHWYGDRLAGRLADQAWLRYSMLVADRDAFERRFGERIDLGIWFPEVIFGRPLNPSVVGYRAGSCPVAEWVARHIVDLPTHPRIPLHEFERLWRRHGEWLRGAL